MIKELKLYTVICNKCGADAFDRDNESGGITEEIALELSSDYEFVEIDGGHYCFECYRYDYLENKFIIVP